MQVFQIRENGFNEIKKKLLIRMVPILVVGATVGILIGSINSKHEDDDFNVLPIVIPVMALVVGFSLYNGVNRQKSLFESYKLKIGDNMVTREQLNTPTISIHFNDIVDITRHKNACIAIKGKDKGDLIFIPSQIGNYTELENTLQTIKPIGVKENSSFLEKYQGILWGILVAGLMFCVFTLNNKIAVSLTGSILIGLLIWGDIKTRDNKNIDSKTRKGLWWILLVIASVIAAMIFKLTAS